MEQAISVQTTKPGALRRHLAMAICFAVGLVAFAAATGLGASTQDVSPTTTVDAVISLQVPGAGAIEPGSTQPGITGVSYNGATLQLGSLALGDLSTAGLVYEVTTNNGNGYELSIASASGSPTLSSGGNDFPNLASAPDTLSNPPAETGFGVAASGVGANQAFVAAQWGATGSLFRGLPALPASVVVATRPTPSAAGGDGYRIDYAAGIKSNQSVLADGTYSGNVRLTATAL